MTTAPAIAPVQAPRPQSRPARRTARRIARRLPVWLLVTVLLVVMLYPQFWMIMGSFKTQTEFFANPTWALPEQFNLDNYIDAFTRGNVGSTTATPSW